MKGVNNKIEKKWEATYEVGSKKAVELFYIREESEYEALQVAKQHALEISGTLTDFRKLGETEKYSVTEYAESQTDFETKE
mgnify:CR=1 FL=1